MPADPGLPATGTLLFNAAICAYPGIVYGTAANGISRSTSQVVSSNPTAAGTAGYFRIYSNTLSQVVAQGAVSAVGGAGDMILSTVNLVTTSGFSITNFDAYFATSSGNILVNTGMANYMAVLLSNNTPSNLGAVAWASGSNIKFYSGTPPANADLAATGTLLATKSYTTSHCDDMNAPLAGTITMDDIIFTASATGTVSYVRLFAKSNNTAIIPDITIQFNGVGVTDSSDVQLSSLSTVSGQPFTLMALSLSL